MKYPMGTAVLGLAIGLFAACGDDDDDGSDNGPSLESVLQEMSDDARAGILRMQDFGCGCIHEVDPQYDCADIYGSGGDDSFPDSDDITACDREVYAEFGEETREAADCVVAAIDDAADAVIDAGCEAFIDGAEGENAFEGVEERMEACTDEVDQQTEAWIDSHGKESCVGFYGME